MKDFSLAFRLTILILLVFIISSVISISISMYQTKKSLIELFDTQLYYFAKKVSTSNINFLINSSSNNNFMDIESEEIDDYLSIEDDSFTFSIFSIKGNLLFTDGEYSRNFIFKSNVLETHNGFYFEENKNFRIIWMLSKDKDFVVVVAQEKEYINDLIFDTLEDLFYPWLFILPFLIIITISLIKKELKPLNKLSKDLSLKNPNDSSFLNENTTKELKPVIKALNSLLKKINDMIDKERRFTSNAAHELKTPLTAIKVQTEVAKLSIEDKQNLLKSLSNIELGVDRTTRIIEQLLSLSRIDSINEVKNLSKIDWIEIINSIIEETKFNAKEKNINILFTHKDKYKRIEGEPVMISLLLKNILDNAIKYNKKDIYIKIDLQENSLSIEDNGKGVNPEILNNIGERFLRPAGQKETGSGLGFSIIKQIAKIHNIKLKFENINPSGFKVTFSW